MASNSATPTKKLTPPSPIRAPPNSSAFPKREPLLRIRQVIYSTKGNVILYVLGLYRSDRHNLVIRRYR